MPGSRRVSTYLTVDRRWPDRGLGDARRHDPSSIEQAASSLWSDGRTRPGNVGRHTPRNELLDHGLARATHETERGVGEDQAHPTLVAGIVRVRQRRGTHATEQVRVIGHRFAAVTACGD